MRKRWARLAQRDLNRMRRAVDSLSLAKALEEPLQIINSSKEGKKVLGAFPPRKGASGLKGGEKDAQLRAVLARAAALKLGKGMDTLPVGGLAAELAAIWKDDSPKFELLPEETPEGAVKRLCGIAMKWQRENVDYAVEEGKKAWEMLEQILAGKGPILSGLSSRAMKTFDMELQKEANAATNAIVAAFLLENIPQALNRGALGGLARLARIGSEKAYRYKKADGISKSAKSQREKWAAMKRKFEIACPEALEAIRAQSEIRKEAHMGPCAEILEEGEGHADCTVMRRNGRTEVEDGWRIKREYPGLYKIMMNSLTEEEQHVREIKKGAKAAMQKGVPPEFVRQCLKNSINDAEGIVDLYLAFLESEEKPPSVSDGGAVEEAMGKLRRAGWKPAKRRGNGATEKEMENGERAIRNKKDLTNSIRLSTEARAHIRNAGLSPRDVLNVLIKGFNMGQRGKAAVGGGHFRGDIIRGNIRRYLMAEYLGRSAEMPKVEALVDYLKSIGIVRKFGSSASTRTKDDAMSIETNPKDKVGKEIVTKVNAVLIKFRRNG